MALSPAKRHFIKATAALDAASAAPSALMAGLSSYEMQLAQLHQDQLRLSSMQSMEARAQLKAGLLPAYADYVAGVLSAGRGAQDDVLVTVMVWRFDAGDWAGGLDIAEYVLQHGLKMPDRFNRKPGCTVAEELAEASFKALKAGSSIPIDILKRTDELTADEDMPDQVRAKLKLAMGRTTLLGLTEENPGQPGDVQVGVDLMKRAIELHDSCGGKKDLERAERLLKKIADPVG